MTLATLDHISTNDQKRSGIRAIAAATPVSLAPSREVRTRTARSSDQRSWRLLGWRTVAVLVVAASVVTIQPWKKLFSQPVSVASQPSEKVRSVHVERPAPATTASVALPATIRPWQTTTLFARASGYLTAWHKDLGAQVRVGDLLAELETPELDQEVAEGEASVHEAVAAVIQAKAERAEAEADLQATQSQLVRIRAEAELARLQFARRELLLARHAMSQEEFDTFQKEVEVRRADVAAAESDVKRRRTNLETRAAIIAAREATASSRQANVERLRELQSFKRIVAPFDGVVTRRSAEVGMLVTAGKESLFVVEDMSRVRVQINVPQMYAAQIRSGVAATVSVPESAARTVNGTITRIADSVDPTNRTMLAEMELANKSHRFQPGSYAQVTLTAPQDASSWTIPTNTVQMGIEGPHVALVNDRNQVEIKRVRLGRDLGNRVVVVDGIRGDERLVVNPGDELRSGVDVKISVPNEVATAIAQR